MAIVTTKWGNFGRYYKVGQPLLQSWVIVIINWVIVNTNWGNRYHKVEQSLLQKGAIVIINGGNFYYKVGQSLLLITESRYYRSQIIQYSYDFIVIRRVFVSRTVKMIICNYIIYFQIVIFS